MNTYYERIDNEQLYNCIKSYKEQLKEDPKAEIPYYIYKSFYIMANKYSYKKSFINYTYRVDMVSDAILNCIKYVTTYDCDNYKNPYSYFTMAIHNIFLQTIKKEKYQSLVKDVCIKEKINQIQGYGRKVVTNDNNKNKKINFD